MEQSLSNKFSLKNTLIMSALFLMSVSIYNTWNNIIIVKDDQFSDEFFGKTVVTSNPVVAQGITSPNYVKNVNELPNSISAEVAYLEKQTADSQNMAPANSVLKKDAESLILVEAYSPTLNQGIKKEDISGEINTENGNIKSLSFSIPGMDSMDLANLKVEGNIFRFQKDGVDIQGMVYPISNTAYLVNFITGPMQGTRLRFNTEEAEEQQQQYANKMMEEQSRMQEEASKSIASEAAVVDPAAESDVNYETPKGPEMAY